MKEEELIKRLENVDLPGIEVKSHRNRLRTVLIQSWDYKEKPGPGFLGFSRLKMMVPVIAYRPVWQKALASALVVAMIIGLSSIFLLGRDPSGQTLPWETVSAKACAAINEVTSFHYDGSKTRAVWYEGAKVFEDSSDGTTTGEGDFLAPDRIHRILNYGQDRSEEYFIGDRTYNRDSETGEWELTQFEEVNGQPVERTYRWDPEKGEWDIIDWLDVDHYVHTSEGFFEDVQPPEIVEMLKDLKDVEQLSDEVINDTDCLHYRGKGDFPEDSEDEPDITIEIWIGKCDHIIRQQRNTISFEKTFDPLDENNEDIPVPDGAPITVILTQMMRFSDFNAPIEIEAPYEEIVPNWGEPLSSEWSAMASPTTAMLNGIWGSSASDIFAVGDNIILHYDGNSWNQMSSGTRYDFRDVWGSSASDVFAVGWDYDSQTGAILHYDGNSWNRMISDTIYVFRNVWGSSSSDVFAVGWDKHSQTGTILHYDGSKWSTMACHTTAMLNGIWGSSASDVFIVGDNFDSGSIILHYDGTSWSEMETLTFCCAQAIWGSSASNIFTVALDDPTIMHYDGSSWTEMEMEIMTFHFLQCVWGSSASDVFTGGMNGIILHYDSGTWIKMYTGIEADIMCIWGSASSDVFAVGEGGTILHYEG